MTHMIALVCNWWNLFVRLAIPYKYHEAIISRILLLSNVGRLVDFIDELKTNAPQLSSYECWKRTLSKAVEKFKVNLMYDKYTGLPEPA